MARFNKNHRAILTNMFKGSILKKMETICASIFDPGYVLYRETERGIAFSEIPFDFIDFLLNRRFIKEQIGGAGIFEITKQGRIKIGVEQRKKRKK